MNSCAWCRQLIDADAVVCGLCGKPVIALAIRVYRANQRYVFGEATGDRAAIWDLTRLPEPVFIQPAEKLKMVSDTYDYWEAASQRPAPEAVGSISRTSVEWGAFFVILILVVGGYVGIHSHRYENCLIQPGIFAWPTSCL